MSFKLLFPPFSNWCTQTNACSPVLRPRSHAAPSPTLSVALESVNGRGISTTCCLAIPSPRVRAEGPRAQKPAYLSQHPSTSAGSPAGSPTPRRARVGRRSRGNSGAAIAPFQLWLPVTGGGRSAAGYLCSVPSSVPCLQLFIMSVAEPGENKAKHESPLALMK